MIVPHGLYSGTCQLLNLQIVLSIEQTKAQEKKAKPFTRCSLKAEKTLIYK